MTKASPPAGAPVDETTAQPLVEQPVASEREEHARSDRCAAQPGADRADDRREVQHVGHAPAHVALRELSDRCRRARERAHARRVGAEAEGLHRDADT